MPPIMMFPSRSESRAAWVFRFTLTCGVAIIGFYLHRGIDRIDNMESSINAMSTEVALMRQEMGLRRLQIEAKEREIETKIGDHEVRIRTLEAKR